MSIDAGIAVSVRPESRLRALLTAVGAPRHGAQRSGSDGALRAVVRPHRPERPPSRGPGRVGAGLCLIHATK